MTVRDMTVVRRTFNKGSLQTLEAKLGKNQRLEEPRLATLFFGTHRNKACPLESGNSVTRSQGEQNIDEYGGVITATASAQLADCL